MKRSGSCHAFAWDSQVLADISQQSFLTTSFAYTSILQQITTGLDYVTLQCTKFRRWLLAAGFYSFLCVHTAERYFQFPILVPLIIMTENFVKEQMNRILPKRSKPEHSGEKREKKEESNLSENEQHIHQRLKIHHTWRNSDPHSLTLDVHT